MSSKLNPVALFYLEQHADSKSPAELATELDVDARVVKAALKQIRKARAEAERAAGRAGVNPDEVPRPSRTRAVYGR